MPAGGGRMMPRRPGNDAAGRLRADGPNAARRIWAKRSKLQRLVHGQLFHPCDYHRSPRRRNSPRPKKGQQPSPLCSGRILFQDSDGNLVVRDEIDDLPAYDRITGGKKPEAADTHPKAGDKPGKPDVPKKRRNPERRAQAAKKQGRDRRWAHAGFIANNRRLLSVGTAMSWLPCGDTVQIANRRKFEPRSGGSQ